MKEDPSNRSIRVDIVQNDVEGILEPISLSRFPSISGILRLISLSISRFVRIFGLVGPILSFSIDFFLKNCQ